MAVVEKCAEGFRVRTGPKGHLPGYYLNELEANKAKTRFEGQRAEALKNRKPRAKKAS